ncbi:transporter [Phenylobacterium sp.]|uniref:transporter n=1 Tax=Phenylobacterium sp. TaxID=1871053 RepID=UPI0035626625
MRSQILLALGFAILAAAPARAQDLRDLCAQRPGKATPPCILDAGHLQIEVGLADAVFQRRGGVHEDTYTLGAAELRVGVTPRIELEAGWSPAVIDTVRGGERRTGAGDASFAVLGALTDPDGKGVAVSAQGFVTLPTATHGLGAGGWTGGVRLPIAAPLSDSVSLGLTPEIDLLRDAAGGGVHAAWVGVASLSRAFGPTTLGAELWGEVEDEPAGTIRRASADLTAAVAVGKSLQFDVGANFGLNHATPNAEIYAGIARRF